jgi:hypothetical protein
MPMDGAMWVMMFFTFPSSSIRISSGIRSWQTSNSSWWCMPVLFLLSPTKVPHSLTRLFPDLSLSDRHLRMTFLQFESLSLYSCSFSGLCISLSRKRRHLSVVERGICMEGKHEINFKEISANYAPILMNSSNLLVISFSNPYWSYQNQKICQWMGNLKLI